MNDCCCFCPGWHYYMDRCGNFWVPYEVPADRVDCGDDCWCWEGCVEPTGPTGPIPTGPTEPTGPIEPEGTPESLGVFPLTPEGAYDFWTFWYNRLADGWIYPVAQADSEPNRNSIDPGGVSVSWRFNTSRSGGTRSHAGVDLGGVEYGRVQAMADGTVKYIYPNNFYAGTGGVVVQHRTSQGNYVAVLYGEIRPAAGLSVGQSVTQGQTIGEIQRNNITPPSWMLHFVACFDGTADVSGSVAQTGNTYYIYVSPNYSNTFNSRSTLIDPTHVELLKSNPNWP